MVAAPWYDHSKERSVGSFEVRDAGLDDCLWMDICCLIVGVGVLFSRTTV